MTRTAAHKTTDPADVRKAKRAFFTNLFDLTWRMLGAMFAPLMIGLYIDSKNGSGKGFAMFGFFLGLVFSALVIRSVVVKISKGGIA